MQKLYIGLNGGQISVKALCSLQSPYKIPGQLLTALIFLYCEVDKLPDFSSLFIFFLIITSSTQT